MILGLMRQHRAMLVLSYGLTTAGYLAAQLYPLATGVAINGVIQHNFILVGWLVGCHIAMMVLEVSAKMLDTRVFSAIYTKFASDVVKSAHEQAQQPSLIAGRSVLLREYVTFLERDVPAGLLSAISLSVALIMLFWFDWVTGAACMALLVPATIINSRLGKRSRVLNRGLNNRLEREVAFLQKDQPHRLHRHFRALAMWRIKLSDLEAKSYGLLEMFVICLFGIALWRVADRNAVEAGTIYAIFAYVWRFVTSMDQVPQIVQQIAKLADIGRRLSNANER